MITKSQINTIKSLKEKNTRTQLSMFVAEGEKMFEEIVSSEFLVKQLFFIRGEVSGEALKKIGTLSKKNSCEIFEVSASEMTRITYLKTPTPILLCVEIPRCDFHYREGSLILALDGVQDPGNLGTIIRIAD
ncbi:MAG: RNA methyltransferase, partial [Rikenellaceae bacterium]